MPKLKCIYIVAWGYPSNLEKGNPFVKEIAEAISRRGVKVIMLVLVFRGIGSFFRKRNEKWASSNEISIEEILVQNWLPAKFSAKSLQRRLAISQVGARLDQIMQIHGRPDAFQFHYILHSSCWVFEKFLNTHQIPYVLFEHSPGSSFLAGISRDFGGFRNLLDLKTFVDNASLRLARIEKYKKKLMDLYGAKFHTLPSFISKEFESLGIDETSIRTSSQSVFTFIGIGSLIERKRFDLLINSFISAFDIKEDVQLLIVGDGPLRSDLENQIKSIPNGFQVRLLGELPKNEVFKQIQKSQVVVVSSAWETFGNTVLEGMLLGKPVLSTRCDGPETIITSETGLLCDKSEKSLANGLKHIYSNIHLYDSKNIKKHCLDLYSEKSVMDQLSKLYQQSLSLDF